MKGDEYTWWFPSLESMNQETNDLFLLLPLRITNSIEAFHIILHSKLDCVSCSYHRYCIIFPFFLIMFLTLLHMTTIGSEYEIFVSTIKETQYFETCVGNLDFESWPVKITHVLIHHWSVYVIIFYSLFFIFNAS